MEYAVKSGKSGSKWMTIANREVHHIVGKGWKNAATFGRSVINSFDNMISLPKGMHGQINKFFNRGRGLFKFLPKGSRTLQQFVATMPLEAQAQWGLAVLDYIIIHGTLTGFSPLAYNLPMK